MEEIFYWDKRKKYILLGQKKSFRNRSKEEIIRGLEALLTCKLVTREAFSYPPQSVKI